MSLSCTVYEIQRVVENRRFKLNHIYLAPPLGVIPLEFRRYFWKSYVFCKFIFTARRYSFLRKLASRGKNKLAKYREVGKFAVSF